MRNAMTSLEYKTLRQTAGSQQKVAAALGIGGAKHGPAKRSRVHDCSLMVP